MATDDTDTKHSDLDDTPEMRRLLQGISNLSPEKLRRFLKIIEDAINNQPSSSEKEEPK